MLDFSPLRKYEGCFILPPEEASEGAKQDEKRLEEILHRFGGRVLDRKEGGRRLLGYTIRRHREGRVLFWNFEMDTRQVGELRKVLELDERILKSTLFRLPEPKRAEEPRKVRRHSKAPVPEKG